MSVVTIMLPPLQDLLPASGFLCVDPFQGELLMYLLQRQRLSHAMLYGKNKNLVHTTLGLCRGVVQRVVQGGCAGDFGRIFGGVLNAFCIVV